MTEAQGLAAYLAPLLPDLPCALVGQTSRRRIAAAAARLPPQFAFQTFGFECPLGTAAASADFLVSAVSRRNGAAVLAAAARKQPRWTAVAALAGAMASPQALVDDVWLEFDLDGAEPDVPNLFCRPLYPPGDAAALLAGARKAVALLAGAPPDRAVIDAIECAAASLPAQAIIFQIGVMRARSLAGVRLCINQISLDGIIGLLDRLGYGDVAAVEALLVRFQNRVGDVTLAVDLGPDLGPKIGLECYFAPSRRRLSPAELIAGFVADLQSCGVCTSEKAAALHAYGGVTELGAGAGAALATTEALLGPGSSGRFRRSVHHIKLVHRPGAGLEAKAYLAVRHELFR